MTNKIDPKNNDIFKQVYVRTNRNNPYTSARIGHDDYLQTNVWRELRNERLIKDFHRCARCGTGINVEVHHIRYPEIWGMESVDDDLITLCSSCHTETHKNDIHEETPF